MLTKLQQSLTCSATYKHIVVGMLFLFCLSPNNVKPTTYVESINAFMLFLFFFFLKPINMPTHIYKQCVCGYAKKSKQLTLFRDTKTEVAFSHVAEWMKVFYRRYTYSIKLLLDHLLLWMNACMNTKAKEFLCAWSRSILCAVLCIQIHCMKLEHCAWIKLRLWMNNNWRSMRADVWQFFSLHDIKLLLLIEWMNNKSMFI